MSDGFELRRIENLHDPEILSLVARSDEYLGALYPPESNHAEPLEVLVGGNSSFFAGYLGGHLAACGAVKLTEDDTRYAEVKRVFVDREYRGQGLAQAVMRYLEHFALNEGAKVMRLETGARQPEALGLFRKIGYVERGPFGAYKTDPHCIFMQKDLDSE